MKITVETTISRMSLRNKSKDELVDLGLMYADFNGRLHAEIEDLKKVKGFGKRELLNSYSK